ncbi:MAG: NAD(P)-dependent oxidoreductase [Thermoplasmata archaeon]|nr:NAD(P)-dependent oxidoreductase [Thermoplasmata archaeon]
MRVLVVGAGGQVGRRVCALAVGRSHQVFGTFRSRPPALPADAQAPLDKTDASAVRERFERFRPELVVDTGALHQVDYCEQQPEEAHRVNEEGTRHLAEAADAASARFVYVSTDFVFGNDGRSLRTEDDPTGPISVYGASKLAGERAALRACSETVVARPSVIFGWNDPSGPTSSSGKNLDFGTWVVDQLRRGLPLRIVHDQVASPTYSEDLALAILRLGESKRTGVYHTGGATRCSRYEFTVRLAAAAGFGSETIEPVRTAELHQLAQRPSDSSLDSGKLMRELGHRTMGLEESLPRFADALRSGPAGVGPPT